MANDIDYEELSSKNDELIILDVRNPDEIEATGHIPGAHNLPLKEVEEALKLDDEDFSGKFGFEKPKKDDTVVTHCHKGGRARKAGDLMAANGFSVRVYAGSFTDWKAQGGEVVPGKP